MRVLVRAPMNRYSGYGNDGMDIVRFLHRAGVDVYPFPVSIWPGVPEDFAMLLTKKLRKGDGAYDVTIQFLPPNQIRLSPKKKPRNVSNPGLPQNIAARHIGWSMWEKSKLMREDMIGHGLGVNPWRLLDWMYVTTPMNVEAFAHFDPKTEYRVLPCGIDGDLFPVAQRATTGPTKFCMVGELHIRKDPYVALTAFSELKREKGDDFDAELHLKTTVDGLPRELNDVLDGVFIHHDYWHYDELIRWMHDMHCYLAPSRGEGNHKPPMEFMATGGTVIATHWSGPENWMHPDVGYPLDYQLLPLDRKQPDGPLEARADKEHLKQLMWHVHTSRREASRKGVKAAEWIRWVADWGKIIDKLIRDLM